MGTFKAHDGEYFVEPLMKADGSDHDDEHNKPHLVYRHEVDPTRKAQQPCATSESWQLKKSILSFQNSSSLNEDLDVLHNAILLQHPSKNMSFDEKISYSHTRTKRFLSYPRFVEVMLTADAKMVHHYGQNLEHYILTLMSIVAAIYKDPSIGNLINIMIVKLVVIHNEQEGPSISFDAATTLHNFCVWQQIQNIPDDTHPSHHDTAVLITREDICRVRDKCDTLGLAEIGTMCDPYRSCSIIEENGLSTAFTIAHELGHVLNMPHDDSFKCKEAGFKHQFHVMSPTLNYDTSPWIWSKCSQMYITEFLDTGYGECLLDKPNGSVYKLASQLPGILYDVNKQCELMFGPGSQVCPYLKQCKRLWCTSTEGVHKGCRTQHMPLADGTECGSNMHCHHGLCINKEMELRPVDGEWGPWGPYSSCTRTCGGGIKSTTRDCNWPEPKNGGKYCVGRRMKFRSCNTEPCPKGRRDFREEQCSSFDGKHFNINGLPPNVHWLPKYSGILMKDRCKLFCRVAGTTFYYQLKDRVTDGTPCGPETNDLCVQGLCRQAGCDHVLNSKARRDKCGVCGGDNSSCKTLAGTFNSAHYGYNLVVKIPVGATNIDIRQHSYSGKPEDDNYLALADSKGNFVLNGNFVVSMFKREINIHGAIFEYSGSDNSVERINCTDRIEDELILQVLCVGNLYFPDVRYSFSIPIEGRSDQFSWDPNGPRQNCNKICQGIRRRKIICVRKSDHLVVSDQRCEHLPRPSAEIEHCNTQCELRWHVIGKSECSSQCGQGLRTLDIHCMKYSSSKRHSEPVDDKYCGDQPKPPRRESCHGNCLVASWQYTAWSQCSKSCGRGVRSREAYCMNNFGHRLANGECNEHQKIVTQSCSEASCSEWATSEWSECLVTCGKGTRHRHVTCQLNDDKLGDNFCDSNTKPESVKSCELQECASWQVGAWESCTVTCGHGNQMRVVRCVLGMYSTIVDVKECNAASRPRDRQDCELPSCSEAAVVINTSVPIIHRGKISQWRYGSWTPCSVSCGKGNRARYVSCRDVQGGVADESFCSHLPRPAEVSICFVECGEWQVGDWSPCPVSCGNGRVTRQVVCINYRQQIDEDSCDPEGRPSEEQECNMSPCLLTIHQVPKKDDDIAHVPQPENPQINKSYNPQVNGDQWSLPRGNQWRTGPWGTCSSTCASGFQRRAVACQDEKGRHAGYCDEATKPSESRHCDFGPCPQWNSGSWGECTQTCGGGIKTRLVICQLLSGQRLSDQNCEILDKPSSTMQCNAHACPGNVSWHRSLWKAQFECGIVPQDQRHVGTGYPSASASGANSQTQDHLKQESELVISLLTPGYNLVVKIPVGATNIDIRQHSYSGKPEDDNYLALADSKGNFVLNGNFVVSMFKREINIHGAIFEYSGSDNSVERINCTDRIEDELILQVLCVGNLYFPDVRYSFSIPIEGRSDQFSWDPNGPRQNCNKICQGIRRRKIICVRKSDHLVVSDQRCEHLPRPSAEIEHCNTQCELRWHVIGKSECSSQCGQGLRTLDIHCMKYSSSKRHSEPVDDKYCGDQPKPPRRESCHGNCLVASWQYTAWTQCSKSCGRGVRSREAYCMNNFGHRLANGECNEHQKIVTQSCSEASCSEWATSEWSECLVTCGKGTRHRHVTCQLNDDKLGDNFCDSNTKPESVKSCELQECASWQVGAWESCTVTCGHGNQMRVVRCVLGMYSTIVDVKECNAASRPRDRQDCELPSCSEAAVVINTSVPIIHRGKISQWRYGSWTPCSVSCGKGNRARYVSCRDVQGGVADESFCSHLPRPAEVSICFVECGEWQVGDWSPCPVSCGNGRVTRQVVCINYRQQIDEDSCDPEGRPSEEQECNMSPCLLTIHQVPKKDDDIAHVPQPENSQINKSYNPQVNGDQWSLPRGNQWRTGPWGTCSSTCASGFQRRAVACQDEKGRHAGYCDEATKPSESRHCDFGPCPQWNSGSWGECTQTCGGGIKTRLVICQLLSGQRLSDQNCEILDKPSSTMQCNAHACPGNVSWHRSLWKACSVTCGKGVKYRDVYCVNKVQDQLEEEKCRHLPKPRTQKICRADRCPSWKANKWMECSVTCGVGIQQRNVFCRLRGQGRVPEEMCNLVIRPDDKQYCWMPDCIQYQWLADDWQDCSGICRKRESQRKVMCVDNNKVHVNETYCDPATKPSPTKRCRNVSCRRYIVFTGDSSKCLGDCEASYYQKVAYCKEFSSAQKRYSNGLRTVSYRTCPVTTPPYSHKCAERGCLQAATWKVGKWSSKCSATCGVGIVERRVECMTETNVPSDLCLSRLKPEATKTCQAEDCKTFASCKEIHARKAIRKDGEYLLKIRGRVLKVYCSGMQSSSPKEYITLAKGETENFSEVFGYRLQNPYECPFNGSRKLDCVCRNDYLAAGYTVFSKIRLDIITMQIKSTDLLFAHTAFGKAVPFATAGDCYSAAKCPQGQFSINLVGTGLRISSAAKWIAHGNYATVNIHRSQDGTKIYGRCGGYCGKCVPHTGIGLQLQFQ
ncbi:A disintegrin and metalloproteinase with thrombospondin motifs 20 [Rhinatrema bivittatum]|uniref:A disintegrin and metalloproteinase with thrombospondin motifs 20 n=1 Tax=Rhinatrema bivittatum TaxID=194408 RepID=UPI00112C7739|nr:A disintegrin and metalloproteinase with thrombospondin motifs 20 [Rhinatrema bivittatum]